MREYRPVWTGDIVKEMHLYNISRDELADELNVSSTYVSSLLTGKKSSPGMDDRMFAAVRRIAIREDNDAENKVTD